MIISQQIQTYIINILCTYKRGYKQQVLVKDVFNIAGVCKRWRQLVKNRLSGMHLNPMVHIVEECMKHFNNPYCLLDHLHSVTPYNGVACGYFYNPDDGSNLQFLLKYRGYVELLVARVEHLNLRNDQQSFSLSLPNLPLPSLKSLSFEYRRAPNIPPAIYNRLEDLSISLFPDDEIYNVLDECKNLKMLSIFFNSRTKMDLNHLFSHIPRHLIKLHLRIFQDYFPYHLLPTTLEELVIPYCQSSSHHEYIVRQKINRTNSFDLTSKLINILPSTSLTSLSISINSKSDLTNYRANPTPFLPNTLQSLRIFSSGFKDAKTSIDIALSCCINLVSLSLQFSFNEDDFKHDNIHEMYISLATIVNQSPHLQKLKLISLNFKSTLNQSEIFFKSIQGSQSLGEVIFIGGTSYMEPILVRINDGDDVSPAFKGLIAIKKRETIAILNTNVYHVDIKNTPNILTNKKNDSPSGIGMFNYIYTRKQYTGIR